MGCGRGRGSIGWLGVPERGRRQKTSSAAKGVRARSGPASKRRWRATGSGKEVRGLGRGEPGSELDGVVWSLEKRLWYREDRPSSQVWKARKGL